jgi:hypothetical protein
MSQSMSMALLNAQDDDDSVRLPNACSGALIQFDDEDAGHVRCFSVMTREPHVIPPEKWSMIETPTPMPAPPEGLHMLLDNKFLVDHVTRGIMADNAWQVEVNDEGALVAIRLLPPGEGKAQEQWEVQAQKMIE